MAIPRAINAKLVERLIFNFRFKPDALDRVLPVDWLKPQVCNGWSVVSFCILDLEKVIVVPFPSAFGYRTTSCAYRCGVVDISVTPHSNSVYITDRQTDLTLIARLAPWLLLDTILMVRPTVRHEQSVIHIDVRYLDTQPMFVARATPAERWRSEVFPTIHEFANFIKGGVSSYTPSVYGDRLTRVDLVKDEPAYLPLDAQIDMDSLDGVWKDADVVFDSAVRASGHGNYRWTYRGLAPFAL